MAQPRHHRQASARARRSANEQRILDTFEELLADRPYVALTVEDVMSSTGLTRTAFYRYFPDLEAVLVRRLTEVTGAIQESTDWLEAAEEGQFRAGLAQVAGQLASVYRAHGDLFRAAIDGGVLSDGIRDAWGAVIDGFIDLNARRIRELSAAGLARVREPADLARALVLMTEAFLRATVVLDETRYHAGIETLIDVWHRAIFSGDTVAP